MQKVLSIDIGVMTTKISELDYQKKHPRIYRSIIFETPENTFENGYLKNKESIADVLREKLEEAGFKIKDVVFTIASNQILSREVVIPFVKDKQIKAVVEAEAGEYFPRDISDHVVTYTVLEKKPDEKKILILAFAAPSNLVKSYYNLAEILDLNVVAVDYSGNSAYQWLKRTATQETDFVLQINDENSIVTIMNDGVMVLQRTISYGTNMLANSVIDSQMFAVDDYAAATELMQRDELLFPKFMMNISDGGISLSKSEDTYLMKQQAKQMITESLQLLISNLTRIIDYQVTRSNQLNYNTSIKDITITGSGSLIKGIDILISNELAIPVKKRPDIVSVSTDGHQHVQKDKLCEFITCFGAAVAPLNFVPNDLDVKEQAKDFKRLYLLLFVGSIVASIALVSISFIDYQSKLSQRSQLKEDIKDMEYIELKRDEYIKVKDAYNSLLVMEETTHNNNQKMNELLKDLETVLPTGTIVRNLVSNGTTLTMAITVPSKEIAGQVLLQLQLVPILDQIGIAGISEDLNVETGDVNVTFTVSCNYKPLSQEAAQ